MDGMNYAPQAEVEKAEEFVNDYFNTLGDIIDLGAGVVEAIQDQEERDTETDVQVQQEAEETYEPLDD